MDVLAAMDSKEVAELKAQNARLLTMLEQMLLNGAAVAGAAIATGEAPPLAHTATRFGQESLAHVTGEHIKAILDEGLRLTEAMAAASWGGSWAEKAADLRASDMYAMSAAQIAVYKTMGLLYGVPENQTWYMLEGGRLLTRSEHGWAFTSSTLAVEQLGQTIVRLLTANLPAGDKYARVLSYIQNNRPPHGHSAFRPISEYMHKHALPYGAYVCIHQSQLVMVIEAVLPTGSAMQP